MQAWTYNYSTSPSRRWIEASQWCKQHFIGLVTAASQEESDYLDNVVPSHPQHYWIDVSLEKEWMWNRTGEPVPEDAFRWASGEPDDRPGSSCVEIYIKRKEDTGKWNNDNCRKRKGTICFDGKSFFSVLQLLLTLVD